jgi:predicted nucleic acid-binding protein
VSALFLLDRSALARMTQPAVAARIAPILEAGLAATTAVVDLEVLYSARSPSEHAEIRRRRNLAYTWIPMDDAVCRRAIEVQSSLAARGQHRVPIPDLLIAAAIRS